MDTELHSRQIMGNGGTVTLCQGEESLYVTVRGWDGTMLAMLDVDPSEALDVFNHPFADPRVPDVFKRTPEQDEDEPVNFDELIDEANERHEHAS